MATEGEPSPLDSALDLDAVIVIPWGGLRPDWLFEQLSAVGDAIQVASPRGIRVEVIVSCNVPGTMPEAERLLSQALATSSSCRAVDSSDVQGPAHARNIGVAASRAPLILFCDADDVVDIDWVWKMLEELQRADIVRGRLDTSINRHGKAPRRSYQPVMKPIYKHLGYGPMSNLGVTRKAFEACGGISEELLVGEDVDFCWRAQYCGASFALANGAFVKLRWRLTLAGHFRQAYSWGLGDVELLGRHRTHGARSASALEFGLELLKLLVLLALGVVSGRRRWRGAHLLGKLLGRGVGSVRTRRWSF